jgi:hypothetical protein
LRGATPPQAWSEESLNIAVLLAYNLPTRRIPTNFLRLRQVSGEMGYSANLPTGTKSIRSQADVEDYIANLNADNTAGYTAYYSKDAVVSNKLERLSFNSNPHFSLV